MSAPNYSVPSLDLATARDAFPVVTAGIPVDSITVLALPGGATISARLGPNKAPIPLLINGQTLNICPAADEGIFIDNPIGAGVVVLLISLGGGVTAIGV